MLVNFYVIIKTFVLNPKRISVPYKNCLYCKQNIALGILGLFFLFPSFDIHKSVLTLETFETAPNSFLKHKTFNFSWTRWIHCKVHFPHLPSSSSFSEYYLQTVVKRLRSCPAENTKETKKFSRREFCVPSTF